ncbi:MAG: C1 family peptidase [Bacteroidales bacterium]|nr:C1 family peptidase [Bacteroidales bacterium]
MKAMTLAALLTATAAATAQSTDGYQFTTVVNQKVTPVKNQAATGTCWCFATTSFFEAELLRMGKGEYDLSEMFIVRQKYMNQLDDNYLRRGKGNLGPGSISPTWVTAFRQVGIVPEEVYSGINYDSPTHNHKELGSYVGAIAETAVQLRQRSPEYYELVNSLFDIYLGKVPEKFTYRGKEYTPKTFAVSLGLNMDDYVMLTSFTHKPYYAPMEVEVPDNWEHAEMYNLPLDELMQETDNALQTGYTVCWDGDVSEKGFSFKNGVAINPEVEKTEDLKDTDFARWNQMDAQARLAEAYRFEGPCPEVKVTPEIRQQGYEAFVTTDDHLMHLTGIAKDQNGTKYYITKNSWGTARNDFGGYLNMSESYVRAKTIFVMMHKDALTKGMRQRLGLR